MDDPVQRHPTRAEQLDILASIVAETVPPSGTVLEFGCGVGYVAHLILEKQPALSLTGVDRNSGALAQAKENLADYQDAFAGIEGDLERIGDIPLPSQPFNAIYTALTFHDLPDTAKQAVIAAAAERLTSDGVFLLYDRIRLTAANQFPLQQVVWSRIERIYGTAMRTAETYDAYIEDLGTDNRPASLADYLDWFPSAGLTPQVIHLHGNIALIGGTKD